MRRRRYSAGPDPGVGNGRAIAAASTRSIRWCSGENASMLPRAISSTNATRTSARPPRSHHLGSMAVASAFPGRGGAAHGDVALSMRTAFSRACS